MKVLFLTLIDFNSLQERNIYTDLLREFVKNGHKVCAISPVERKKGIKTHMIKEKNVRILKLQIGNKPERSRNVLKFTENISLISRCMMAQWNLYPNLNPVVLKSE